jgi:hypothetical protein
MKIKLKAITGKGFLSKALLWGTLAAGSAMGQNLLDNGDFENDFSGWTNLVGGTDAVASFSLETSDVHAGTGAMRADVTTAGTNAWDVQSMHTTWPSVEGNEFTLTFWGKAVGSASSVRMVMQNSTYASRDFSLSTDWQQYEWVFNAQETDLQLKIHFFESGSILLDDFEITGDTGSGTGDGFSFTVDTTTRYQEMVGFGGALTWYSDRVTSSPNSEEIMTHMFDSLDLDILRLKNWYYPANYPANTAPTSFETSWFSTHFAAAPELYNRAKEYDENLKVLLSSWGPPSALKSNGALEEGALKKENGVFMYSELAQYYMDVLDNVGFEPDWFSIQNEQGYTNSGWTTCEWRPQESDSVASFTTAFDSVYQRLQQRSVKPLMLGGETENIASAVWDNSQNSFGAFADELLTHPGVYAWGFHLYNYAGTGINSSNASYLNMIRDSYGNKPAIMTEFSSESLSWSAMANVIQSTLMESNAAGYVYWQLMWDESAPNAMVTVDANGDYVLTDYYYLMKHFSRYISQGDTRVEISGSGSSVKASAYLKPTGDSLVVVITNNSAADETVVLNSGSSQTSLVQYFQSVEGSVYNEITGADLSNLTVPARSVSTLLLDLTGTVTVPLKQNYQSQQFIWNQQTSTLTVLGDARLIRANGEVRSLSANTTMELHSEGAGVLWLEIANEIYPLVKGNR